jgi:hypothetical protein
MNDKERICETVSLLDKKDICVFKIKIKPYDIKRKRLNKKITRTFLYTGGGGPNPTGPRH